MRKLPPTELEQISEDLRSLADSALYASMDCEFSIVKSDVGITINFYAIRRIANGH